MRSSLGLGLSLASSQGVTVSIDPDAQTFIDRVLADGGTVEDASFLNAFVNDAKANNYWNDIFAAYSPSWGVKGGATASDLYSVTGVGFDLGQGIAANQPAITLADLNGKTRLLFDGLNDLMGPTVFAYSQPETIILMGMEQESWTTSDSLYDGGTNATVILIQTGVSPEMALFDGGGSVSSSNEAAIGSPVHNRALYNGTNNRQQIDNNAEKTGVGSSGNSGGFTLGSRASGSNSAHFDVGAVVLLGSAVDANYDAKMTALYNFSKSVYGTA